MHMERSSEDAALIRRISLYTETIFWKELRMFFAQGKVIFVSDTLNLVEVAFQMAKDNQQLVDDLMRQRQIEKLSDTHAADWFERDIVVRATVVTPWVLVQEQSERSVAPIHSAFRTNKHRR